MRKSLALIGAVLLAGTLAACGGAIAEETLEPEIGTALTITTSTTEAPSTTQATTTTVAPTATETPVSAELMMELMQANCEALDAGLPVSELVALSEESLLDADTSMVDVLTLVSISVATYCPSHIDAVSTVIVYEYPEYSDAVLAAVEDFL